MTDTWVLGPQSPDLIAGKVLRIDGDGNAHPGNKFKGDKRVYSLTDIEMFKV